MSRFVPWLFFLPPREFRWVFVFCLDLRKPPTAHTSSHIFWRVSPSRFRVRPWPSSSEQRPTWSAPPSRQRRASTAFSVLRLRPAWTNCSLRTNPAPCAASPRDSYTFPARRSCSPPHSARTSPRVAPLCKYSWDTEKKARTRQELQPLQWGLLFAASLQTLSHSLTPNSSREPNVQRMKNCLMLLFNDTCTKTL